MTPTVRLLITDYAADARQRPHSHDELHFSLILRGGVAETVGGTTEYAGALAVVAKDAGVLHANQWGRTGARIARLSVRGGTLAGLAASPARADGWRWTHDPAVARPFLRLIDRSRRGEAAFELTDVDMLDVVAAFTARREAEPRGIPPVWLREIVNRVLTEWHPQLNGHTIATWAQVHPVYLARCVRRWYGIALGDLLRAQRRRAAVAAVTDSAHRLTSVAYEHGYADEPHLCRDVRDSVGLSPGRLRTLIRSV